MKMTSNDPNKRWCVAVFSKNYVDEWHFKRFRNAWRFAKKNLKKGYGVTVEFEIPNRFSTKGKG